MNANAVSPEEIHAAMTPRGGWTRAQLATWGVPWPPPSGWKKQLEQHYKQVQRKMIMPSWADIAESVSRTI
jgi:hypothetical protein